ncbi:MAG: sensor histidine kinase [Acidimicrobiia bacterium]|nr:sensor histidine kinase [Acidimicrobiia bacterium]
MSAPACTSPDQGSHAWERAHWVFHVLIPILLGVSLLAAATDAETSSARVWLGAGLSAAMVAWYWLLRPYRDWGDQERRAVTWGLGSVLLWLPLVLVHPAFFLVLTGLFTTLFANLAFRPASWLAGLLGVEIVLANLFPGDPTGGDVLITLASTAPLIVASVVFAHWIHGIIDQSRDRHLLIEELEATQADLVAAERTAGIHQERARLTGEIHDTLAQGFTSIVMLLQAVETGLGEGDASRRQVELAIDTARDGLDDARRLMADLDPEPLDSHSLPDAIGRVAARFSDETGVRTEVELRGDQRRLPATVEVALLRATQESLANVRKHAAAAAVTITLRYGHEVTLRVTDDGSGFDPADPTAGFGLRGMRERLATVHGRVQVESEPGHGTQVLVEVP